jgi:LPXTG-motif cell wall-anchored protein
MQELVEAVPGPGGGDLFDQLVLTVQYEDTKLYQGPMSGFSEPLEMTGLIGSLVSGQVKEIDITIYLPGSETGNEYQGSFVKTSYSVLIQCAGANGSSENCTITLLPEDTLFSLGNLNPGDRYHRKLGFSITFMPSYSCETAWGYGGAKATPFPKEDREIIVMPSKADVSSDRVDKPAVPVPSEIVINPVRPEVHKLSGERHPLPQTGGNSALMGTIGVLMITMGIWLRRKSRN